jgi:hypothetical protein
MMASIERLRRLIPTYTAMSALVVLGGVMRPSDPVRHASKSTGVLLVPETDAARSMRLDSILQTHHDRRSARGRVLYADGRTERSCDSTRAVRAHDLRTARQTAPTRGHPAAPGSE